MFGLRFYRQRPVLDYIVDFYCPAAKLVIELDGSQHFETKKVARDLRRTQRLNEEGLLVLRFDDRQVLTETTAVLEAIREAVTKRL